MYEKYQLKYYGANLAPTNQFNDVHGIVRVVFNDKYYDFRYQGGFEVPHYNTHIAVIYSSDEYLDGLGLTEQRLLFPPGIIDAVGNLVDDLPIGHVVCYPRLQMVKRTNPTSGGAGFSNPKTGMYDLDNIAIAISPPSDKVYTNTDIALTSKEIDEGSKPDPSDKSIGIFINKDNTILLKGLNGSITLGADSIYIAGSVGWETVTHQKEFMMDNPFKPFIPPALPTAALTIDTIPNLTKFVQIAEGARKVRDIISKTTEIATDISNA